MKNFIDRKLLEEERKISKLLEQVCLKADIKLDSQGFPIGLMNHPLNTVNVQTVSVQTDPYFVPFTATGKLFLNSEELEEGGGGEGEDHHFDPHHDESLQEHSLSTIRSHSNKSWEGILIEQLSKENEYLIETKQKETELLQQQIQELQQNLFELIKWRNSTVNQSMYLITSFEKKLEQKLGTGVASSAPSILPGKSPMKKGPSSSSSAAQKTIVASGGIEKGLISRLLKQLKQPLQEDIPLSSNFAKYLMNQLLVSNNPQLKGSSGGAGAQLSTEKSDHGILSPGRHASQSESQSKTERAFTDNKIPQSIEKSKSEISLMKLFPITNEDDLEEKTLATSPAPPQPSAVSIPPPPPPPPTLRAQSSLPRWPPLRPPPPSKGDQNQGTASTSTVAPSPPPPPPSSSLSIINQEAKQVIPTDSSTAESHKQPENSQSNQIISSSLLPITLQPKSAMLPSTSSHTFPPTSLDSFEYCLNCKKYLLMADLQFHEMSVHELYPYLTPEREYLLLKLFYLLSLMQYLHNLTTTAETHPLQKQRELQTFQFYSFAESSSSSSSSSSSLDMEKKRKQLLQMSYITKNIFILFLFSFDLFDEKFTIQKGNDLFELCRLVASKKSGKPRLKLNYADFVFLILQLVQSKYRASTKSNDRNRSPTKKTSASTYQSSTEEMTLQYLDQFTGMISPVLEHYLLNPRDLDHVTTLYWDLANDEVLPIICEAQELLYNNFKRSKSYGLYHPETIHFTTTDLIGGSFSSFENYCINYQLSPSLVPLNIVRLITQTTKRLCGLENMTFYFYSLYSVMVYIARKGVERQDKHGTSSSKDASTRDIVPIPELKAVLQRIILNNDTT